MAAGRLSVDSVRRLILIAAAATAFLGATASAEGAILKGTVKSGNKVIRDAPITLFKTTVGRRGPVAIGLGRSNRHGRFEIQYGIPGRPNAVLYVVSGVPGTSARRDVRLASSLGAAPYTGRVTLNERTTVATGFTAAQFISGARVNGAAPGPQNAAMMATNLADLRTGRLPDALTTAPNGKRTSARDTFNSLANAIAPCVRNESRCEHLFDITKGRRRTDSVLKAVANIARNAGNNVGRIYRLSVSGPTPYAPALDARPDHWALFLRFVGNGTSVSGPGNVAFDAEGNAWVNNNYTYSRDPLAPQCGSDLVFKFRPDGSFEPGSPYSGGGLSGVGYGITFDPAGRLWLSNFGFAAPACPDQPPHNSLSVFNQAGKALSKPSGLKAGDLTWPQGLTSNAEGDIWTANCGPVGGDPLDNAKPHDSFTIYPGGDPAKAFAVRDPNIEKPFDVAINKDGRGFVSGTKSSTVGMYEADGTPTSKSPIVGDAIDDPMGLASDSRGNVWVASSNGVDLPCPGDSIDADPPGRLALIGSGGNLRGPEEGYTGGGLVVPWGIAVDGADNVWVSNFAKRRIAEVCGVREKGCGKGLSTGDQISPGDTGWNFDGFTRLTAVEIDPTGNVWITNNWKQVPFYANPGGYQVVVMLGAAAPVKTPLIGQPKPLNSRHR